MRTEDKREYLKILENDKKAYLASCKNKHDKFLMAKAFNELECNVIEDKHLEETKWKN